MNRRCVCEMEADRSELQFWDFFIIWTSKIKGILYGFHLHFFWGQKQFHIQFAILESGLEAKEDMRRKKCRRATSAIRKVTE